MIVTAAAEARPRNSLRQEGKIALLGASGMIGQALAGSWAHRSERHLQLLFHRSSPQWQAASGNVDCCRVDLESADDVLRVLGDATVLIDMLGACGDGWRYEAARMLSAVLARSNVRHVVHVSTIDVYGAQKAPVVDAETPPEPSSPYAQEQLATEQLAEGRPIATTVLRLGAVFGPGSKNLVALAEETAVAPKWRLAARRALSGTRRLHLVSLETVVDALTALAGMGDGAPRRIVLTDDAAPENNFAYAQDLLIAALRRPPVSRTPILPRAVLGAALSLRGQPSGLAYRRFRGGALREVEDKAIACFPAHLSAYVDFLASNVRSR